MRTCTLPGDGQGELSEASCDSDLGFRALHHRIIVLLLPVKIKYAHYQGILETT